MNVTGFFDLRGPRDLLAKLNHDLNRLADNPRDTYAAFDFFVTAAHMHEWMQKSGHSWSSPTDPLSTAVFKLCGDVGNGAKHFVMENRVPEGHEVRDGAFDPSVFDPSIFDTGDLIIHLSTAEADALNASLTTALDLAALVRQYWHNEIDRLPIAGP